MVMLEDLPMNMMGIRSGFGWGECNRNGESPGVGREF